MSRDILFLLPPGFVDNGRHEYCPECAEMWGLLSYYPALKESVEIRYQPISKPRVAMVDLLGEKNQNCPTLVLTKESPGFENCGILNESGYKFINNVRDIGLYYATRYGIATPRGH